MTNAHFLYAEIIINNSDTNNHFTIASIEIWTIPSEITYSNIYHYNNTSWMNLSFQKLIKQLASVEKNQWLLSTGNQRITLYTYFYNA